MGQCLSVSLFMAAVVVANLSVAHFGQAALPFTAFVLIPFDLVVRDVLHETWRGRWLWLRMSLLISTGSILTAALSLDAKQVAFASFAAFLLSGFSNAVVYHLLDHQRRIFKMNASNLVAAVIDSTVFPVIAFSSVSIGLCFAQAGSKFVGGLVWSSAFLFLLNKRSSNAELYSRDRIRRRPSSDEA